VIYPAAAQPPPARGPWVSPGRRPWVQRASGAGCRPRRIV